MATQMEKADAFRVLHGAGECFIIPNPWDPGSARLLAGLGYKALATTSSGFAYSIGKPDGGITLDEKLTHCRAICEATQLPVSADLEDCFADDPASAAKTIKRAAETGIVGGSIEDWSRKHDSTNPVQGLYDFNHAVERVTAAVEAARSLPFPFTLTARAENFLRGKPDMDDTIRRLQAFETAGADVLYAPGLTSLEEVRALVEAVSKPVNVLGVMINKASVEDLAELGVRRISVGGALANTALVALLNAGLDMRDKGSFNWLPQAVSMGTAQDLITG